MRKFGFEQDIQHLWDGDAFKNKYQIDGSIDRASYDFLPKPAYKILFQLNCDDDKEYTQFADNYIGRRLTVIDSFERTVFYSPIIESVDLIEFDIKAAEDELLQNGLGDKVKLVKPFVEGQEAFKGDALSVLNKRRSVEGWIEKELEKHHRKVDDGPNAISEKDDISEVDKFLFVFYKFVFIDRLRLIEPDTFRLIVSLEQKLFKAIVQVLSEEFAGEKKGLDPSLKEDKALKSLFFFEPSDFADRSKELSWRQFHGSEKRLRHNLQPEIFNMLDIVNFYLAQTRLQLYFGSETLRTNSDDLNQPRELLHDWFKASDQIRPYVGETGGIDFITCCYTSFIDRLMSGQLQRRCLWCDNYIERVDNFGNVSRRYYYHESCYKEKRLAVRRDYYERNKEIQREKNKKRMREKRKDPDYRAKEKKRRI